MKTFVLIVEGETIEMELRWSGDTPPDLIYLDSDPLIKVGRYLSPGDRYRYRRPTVACFGADGKLTPGVK